MASSRAAIKTVANLLQSIGIRTVMLADLL